MARTLIFLFSTVSGILLLGRPVFALGLGGLQTHSALYQPFAGEIELLDIAPDQLDMVKVKLAPEEAFNKSGIERSSYLSKLRFYPEVTSEGRTIIRVSSKDPIREPYVDLLLEIIWPKGKLTKEYTALLDPPTRIRQRSNSMIAQNNFSKQQEVGFPLAIGPVTSGNSLWSLARQHQPSGATLSQTIMAFYRNNQRAFVHGDIRRLKSGVTLTIPTSSELLALDATTAQREYHTALQGGNVQRAPLTEIPANLPPAQLRIAGVSPLVTTASSANQSNSNSRGPRIEQDVLRALETSESNRQEAQELRNRVKDLETQLSDIQQLLKLRDAELSRMQEARTPSAMQSAAPQIVQQPVVPESTATTASITSPPVTQTQINSAETTKTTPPVLEPVIATNQSNIQVPTLNPAEKNAQESAQPASNQASLTKAPAELLPVPTPTPSQTAATTSSAAKPPAKNTVKSTNNQTASTSTSPPASPVTWYALLLPILGLAGVIALGILVIMKIRARQKNAEQEDLEQTEMELEPESVVLPSSTIAGPLTIPLGAPTALTGEGTRLLDADLEERDEFDSINASSSMISQFSNINAETDEADIVSEADIYIAYGRLNEAQSILLKELKRSPNRLDVKFKLAEVYFNLEDATALERQMKEIRLAGGERAEPNQWKTLEERLNKMRTGSRGPTGGSGAAVTPPAGRTPPQPQHTVALDSSILGDSDFSLDINKIQDPSTNLEPSVNAPYPQPLADPGASKRTSPASPARTQLLDETPEKRTGNNTSGLILIDSNDEAVTIPASSAKLNLDKDSLAEFMGHDSDLILNLEEPHVDSLDDLDALLDSTLQDDSPVVRPGNIGSETRATSINLPDPQLSRDRAAQISPESVSTDLLSSHWQMDGSEVWDETSTKLDLARAYLEMKEFAAAREILEEVLADEQREEPRAEARKLLASINSST